MFDINFHWTTEHFSTCELDFYKKIFQKHDETQNKNTFKMFVVPIRNAKNVEEMKFHVDAPMIKYCQSTLNIYCFSSLMSDLNSINQIKDNNAITNCI